MKEEYDIRRTGDDDSAPSTTVKIKSIIGLETDHPMVMFEISTENHVDIDIDIELDISHLESKAMSAVAEAAYGVLQARLEGAVADIKRKRH